MRASARVASRSKRIATDLAFLHELLAQQCVDEARKHFLQAHDVCLGAFDDLCHAHVRTSKKKKANSKERAKKEQR
jgi:hypothetical protein